MLIGDVVTFFFDSIYLWVVSLFVWLCSVFFFWVLINSIIISLMHDIFILKKNLELLIAVDKFCNNTRLTASLENDVELG